MDLGYRKSEIPATSFPLLCINKKARRNSQGSPGLGFRPQNIDFNANMRLLRTPTDILQVRCPSRHVAILFDQMFSLKSVQ